LQLQTTLNFIEEKVTAYDSSFLSLPNIPIRNISTNVISKVPSNLDNLLNHSKIIDKIPGHEAVQSVESSGDVLLVRINQSAAKDFTDAVSKFLKIVMLGFAK
jgi:hypothetical protein